MLEKARVKQLAKKWDRVLDFPKYAPITERATRENMAVMLENTANYIKEASYDSNNMAAFGGTNAAGSMGADFPKLAIPLLRRVMPGLIANELVGIQPMTSPVGLAFAIRMQYGATQSAGTATSAEAVLNLLDSAVIGNKAPTGLPGWGLGLTCGTETWSSAVGDMAMTIAMQQLSAMTRKLRTSFSLEMAQDAKALHNLDIDDELTNLLTYEIQAEMEQEIINNLIFAAASAEGVPATGTATTAFKNVLFPVCGATTLSDNNEHYMYRRVWTLLMDQAHEIATQTRRGPANWMLCSPKVATCLKSMSNFIISPVANKVDFGNVAVKKLGTVDNGTMTLYLDLFDTLGAIATRTVAAGVSTTALSSQVTAYNGNVTCAVASALTEYALIGYKGSSELDAGIFYCPYVPILVVKAQDPTSFSPKIGVMSRYAITNSLLGQERYYRLVKIDFTGTTLG